MRILHVYRTYFPDTQGGLEETIRQICLSTQALGHTCEVFTLSDNPEPAVVERPEARVTRVKKHVEISSCSISLTGLQTFKERVAEADIVHYHTPWPFADVLHFASGHDKPSLVTYHSDIIRQRVLGLLYKPLQSRFLSSVNQIVCTSPNYFVTSDVLSEHSDRVGVIPIGLDERSFPTVLDSELFETRARFGSDFFLFVGVLRYYKGLHILLDAIKDAPYKVIIVGSGPIENELMAQAKRLGLTNVVFTGYIEESTKAALFKLAKAVVFPSYLRSEAFGVTLLEGAMHSRPLISTEVGSGTSHINVHNETGLVVAPGSVKSLRRAMDQLHHHPEKAQEMGRNARKRFEAHFTADVMGERYSRQYAEILGLETPQNLSKLAN